MWSFAILLKSLMQRIKKIHPKKFYLCKLKKNSPKPVWRIYPSRFESVNFSGYRFIFKTFQGMQNKFSYTGIEVLRFLFLICVLSVDGEETCFNSYFVSYTFFSKWSRNKNVNIQATSLSRQHISIENQRSLTQESI